MHIATRFLRTTGATSLAALLAATLACSGQDASPGTDGAKVLLRTSAAPGASCANGGVEVVSGLATDQRVADTVAATAAAWGKQPVRATSTPGFIVNRCARPFYGEALRLLAEQAADAATLDAILREPHVKGRRISTVKLSVRVEQREEQLL